MIPKIHRINAIHRKIVDHGEDLAGYVERNNTARANETYDKLIREAKNLLAMITTTKNQVIQHTYGSQVRDTCNLCQLEPAAYRNDTQDEYPRLCHGCYKWNGPDMIVGWNQTDWKPI